MSDTSVWVLTPNDERECEELPDPWEPWYDCCFGMIVRAGSPQEARGIAQENAKDETRISTVHHPNHEAMSGREVWTDEDLADCVPISEFEADGEWIDSEVLMQHVHHA